MSVGKVKGPWLALGVLCLLGALSVPVDDQPTAGAISG